jgi:spore coat protein U-like protein
MTRRGIKARLVCALAAAVVALSPHAVAAQQVRINKLTNVAFGTIANLGVDASIAQSVCAYSTTATKGYNVRATGSGTGGAFTLLSGARTMVYEVQWNGSAGQTTGTSLTAGVAKTGFKSTATASGCTTGPLTSASLVVILRAATLSNATAGTYNGTLTLILAPE